MRLKLIACKALSRELSYLSALTDNNIDTTFIRQATTTRRMCCAAISSRKSTS